MELIGKIIFWMPWWFLGWGLVFVAMNGAIRLGIKNKKDAPEIAPNDTGKET